MVALAVHKNTTNEDLAVYLLRILSEKGLSTQDVENRANRAGRKIARSYISRIIGRTAENLTIETLRALADGIDESIWDVLSASLNIGAAKRITKEVSLKQSLWAVLDEDARQSNRTIDAQIEAILVTRYGLGNVGLSEQPHQTDEDLLSSALEQMNRYTIEASKHVQDLEGQQSHLFSTGEEKATTSRESRAVRKDIADIKKDARERTERKQRSG
jgi:transcriptional regulator with XRE-family HTH domain